VVGAFLAWSGLAGSAFAGDCTLAKIVDLPVTVVDMKALVAAKINGEDALFAADSGAFYSMISPAAAAQYRLKTYPAPWGIEVHGVGGQRTDVQVAKVKQFNLAGFTIPNVEFLVGGGEVSGGAVGLLGQNLLRVHDVDYNFPRGLITLMKSAGCRNGNLAYWTAGTSQPYSMIQIEPTTPMHTAIESVAYVNGHQISVVFDTGSAYSVLSLRAAERAGERPDSPGVVSAGMSRGTGRRQIPTWIAPFASFKLGDEEIKNTHLRIGENVAEGIDMLIGADFFLSHRVYVATELRRVFFTYSGGPVFNLTKAAGNALAAPTGEQDSAATGASDDTMDATAFSRRGSAFAARRDFVRAIADFNRACELAPTEPNFFYERAVAKGENNQVNEALADLDRALELKPDHLPALVTRAQVFMARHDSARAVADLDAADRAAPKEADIRLRMAQIYGSSQQFPQAIAQLTLWMASHEADARMVDALGERCRARGIVGQDLKTALNDCSAALRRVDSRDSRRTQLLASRGLVRLRLGDYAKSIDDYSEALKLAPRDASSLYARGIAESRSGKAAAAEADKEAATAIAPKIAERYTSYGIGP
jgi:tetratricopeptide (TPR) repeat protein/predicted aspartyl protease